MTLFLRYMWGGTEYVTGINYSEISFIRRSRQYAWRAAVEMTRNASQLALQVRCLDAHIRWKDLVRPEQIPVDEKAIENETSFRNAVICDKRKLGNKTRYALVFADRKHLPLSVMKNVLEVEATQDGEEKLWFSENYVSLYLIKEYEEKAKDVICLPSKTTPRQCLPAFQRRQLKSWRRDIFTYLLHKEDKPTRCSCASCHTDVLLRDAARCEVCQGYCHKNCIVPSDYLETGVEAIPMCNQCIVASKPAQFEIEEENMNHQLLVWRCNQINEKVERASYYTTRQPLICSLDLSSSIRSQPSVAIPEKKPKKEKNHTFGLVWRKKNTIETGEEFRRMHIISRGGAESNPLEPVCVLCLKKYSSDKMYICCERCSCWVHAEALLLEEDQLSNLIGYKCCKCRRIRVATCPYAALAEGGTQWKPPKEHYSEENQGCMFSEPHGMVKLQNSPSSHLLSSEGAGSVSQPLSEPEPTTTFKSIPPFPRNSQLEGFGVIPSYGSPHLNGPCGGKAVTTGLGELSVHDGREMNIQPPEVSSYPNGNSGVCDLHGEAEGISDQTDGLLGFEEMYLEGMESEPPQTFFSFTELLASGDDQLDQLLDMPMGDTSGSWDGVPAADPALEDAGKVHEEGDPAAELPVEGGCCLQEATYNQEPAAVEMSCWECSSSQPPAFM